MLSRWLPWLQFRLLTLLMLIAILCGLIVANTSESATVLGHVQIRSGPGYPGLFIFGWEYGWPWVYRTEASKGELYAGTGFDRFDRLAFLKNAGVGLGILVGTAAMVEGAMRWRQRRLRIVGNSAIGHERATIEPDSKDEQRLRGL